MTSLSTAPRPSGLTDSRALAPDLARGMMLLLIALANVSWYLYGSSTAIASIHPTDGSTLDRVVQFMIITAVDGRVYPMFAFLFGYGIVQMYQRSLDRGAEPRQIRRVLRRRHLAMIGIGFLHAALLWMGDIVGAYGLVGLIFTAAFLKRRDKTLIIWAAVLTFLLTAAAVLAVVGAWFVAQDSSALPAESFLAGSKAVNGIESYPASILARLGTWAILVPFQGVLSLVIPAAVLLAFWAARRGVLERPAEHRRLLLATAITGITVAWFGGAVHALDHVGALSVPDQVGWVFAATQSITGLLGGLGYVALFGLISIRLTSADAITAVGKRSLTAYLAQSVIFAPLLCAWGLGWGATLGTAGAAALAVVTWLVTVLGCVVLDRSGRRGPAEYVLRRIAYPRH